jgi:polar amino acid transport system substrate-binding protein
MRLLHAMVLVCVLGAVSAAWAEPLRIATEGAYPPFNYFDEQGELTGFDVEIAKALCTAMQRECELVAVEWDHILDGLVADEYDAVVASMANTEERRTRVDFTNPYYRSRSSYLTRADADLEITPGGLAGKTLSTQEGTVQGDYLKRQFGERSTVRLTETTDQALDLLVAGEVDVVLLDSFVGYEFLKSPRGKGFDFVGQALLPDELNMPAHIAVQKNDDDLRKAFNQALKTIRFNGTYDRINRKYFPFSIF